MAARGGTFRPLGAASVKGCDPMFAWLIANWIDIVLIAVIASVTALLIRGMVRDRKAGRSACGGSCADCGACSACGKCREMNR